MNTKILEKIGMTEGEVRVYLALLELGLSSTGKIIDNSHITSSKVYLILERLQQKGLVSHIIKNNVKYFQVADPKRLIDYMESKKREIESDTRVIQELIPFLQSKRNLKLEEQETTMFKGLEGYKTGLKELTSSLKKNDELLVFGARSYFGKKFEVAIKQFYSDNERKGIKTRLIYNSQFKEVKKIYYGFKITKVKFIEHITPSTIVISKNKILIITYGEEPIQVLIKSRQIAESFKEFFESMWQIAKK